MSHYVSRLSHVAIFLHFWSSFFFCLYRYRWLLSNSNSGFREDNSSNRDLPSSSNSSSSSRIRYRRCSSHSNSLRWDILVSRQRQPRQCNKGGSSRWGEATPWFNKQCSCSMVSPRMTVPYFSLLYSRVSTLKLSYWSIKSISRNLPSNRPCYPAGHRSRASCNKSGLLRRQTTQWYKCDRQIPTPRRDLSLNLRHHRGPNRRHVPVRPGACRWIPRTIKWEERNQCRQTNSPCCRKLQPPWATPLWVQCLMQGTPLTPTPDWTKTTWIGLINRKDWRSWWRRYSSGGSSSRSSSMGSSQNTLPKKLHWCLQWLLYLCQSTLQGTNLTAGCLIVSLRGCCCRNLGVFLYART